MKRFVLTALTVLLVAAAPALACSGDKAAKAKMASNDLVQTKVENLDNGVRVLLTSADAEIVKAVQKDARSFLAKQCASKCPMKSEGATHQVKNHNNGVEIIATANCPGKVKELQAYAAERAEDGSFAQSVVAKKDAASAAS